MKKILALGATMMAVIMLAGCGTSSKDAATISSLTRENKKLKAAVGTPDTTKNKEVKSGPLTKVGSWKDDADYGKIQLLHIYRQSAPITIGKIGVSDTEAKIFIMTPKNQKQADRLNENADANSSTGTSVYIAQITPTIKNNYGQDLTFEGFESVVIGSHSYGHQVTRASGIIPDGTETNQAFAMIAIPKEDINSQRIGFAFSNFDNAAQSKQLIDVSKTVYPGWK